MTETYNSNDAEFASVFNSPGGGEYRPVTPPSNSVDEKGVPVAPRGTEKDELDELLEEETPEDEEPVEDDSEDEETDTDLSKLSKEELAKIARKLRRENAKRRVTTNQTTKEIEEFRKWKESQLTEKERLTARIKELEQEKASADHDKLVRRVAKKAGLSLEVADRLRGETEEELLEDAISLAKLVGKRSASTAAQHAGNRGTPVGAGGTPSDSDWFRDLFQNTNR